MNLEIELSRCPLTGLKINEGRAWRQEYVNPQGTCYHVLYKGENKFIRLCPTLMRYLQNNTSSGLKKYFEEYDALISLFWGEISKNDFTELWEKTVHWDCSTNHTDKPHEHIHIKDIGLRVKESGDFPKSRIEKLNIIMMLIRDNQTHEGDGVQVADQLEFWASAYLKNSRELQFYIKQLEKKNYIDNHAGVINLSFDGLDYLESIEISDDLEEQENEVYQIGLSFAGEQRGYVEEVAKALKAMGVSVFYDDYEKVRLWGKDLYQHLNDVYKNKCQFCIVFISEDYARKLWTRHELSSAQSKAFKENREYILPVKFDETEIPGMNETVGYLDGNKESPIQIAKLAKSKIEE